jgi:hypothetical protein
VSLSEKEWSCAMEYLLGKGKRGPMSGSSLSSIEKAPKNTSIFFHFSKRIFSINYNFHP